MRLRVPGVDLWTTHKPLLAEVCLMMMLLGSGALRKQCQAQRGCLPSCLRLGGPPGRGWAGWALLQLRALLLPRWRSHSLSNHPLPPFQSTCTTPTTC